MLFKILQGNEANLPQKLTDGYCYFLKDKHYFYVDHKDNSGELVRSKLSAEFADKLRYINGDTIVEIAPEEIALKSELVTKANKATTLSGYGITDAYTESEIDNMLSSKADKATTLAGYDITDAYTKTQIDNLELISIAEIDAICNVTYVNASDSGVTF